MVNQDTEVEDMLDILPKTTTEFYGDLYDLVRKTKANAKVFWNPERGMLEIFLVGGGWLGADSMVLEGDLAPFSD